MNFILDPEIIKHGIVHILYFDDFAEYKVLVMTKTGPTLFDLSRNTRFGKFEMKTISKIAIQGVMTHLHMFIWFILFIGVNN